MSWHAERHADNFAAALLISGGGRTPRPPTVGSLLNDLRRKRREIQSLQTAAVSSQYLQLQIYILLFDRARIFICF